MVPLYTPSSNAALSHVSLEDLKPPPVHVLFSFISCQVVEQISEQIIAEAFLPFGILTDVNIKKHNTIGVSLVMIDMSKKQKRMFSYHSEYHHRMEDTRMDSVLCSMNIVGAGSCQLFVRSVGSTRSTWAI